MWLALIMLMLCLLLRAPLTMNAAAQACRLFCTSVLPGLFPYMVLSLMLVSRLGKRLSPLLLMLVGWGGGSPTGARLISQWSAPRKERIRLAVATATMSPMFLLGTIGQWLQHPLCGAAVLFSVIAGGFLAGCVAHLCVKEEETSIAEVVAAAPMTFGEAIEQASRTMLLVCGTMVMLRVFADLAAALVPAGFALPIVTLLEVTTGVSAISELPWPRALRTAVIAGATGFGGMAVLMQNRAVSRGLMKLPIQLAFQLLHGVLSFLLAWGVMELCRI